MIDGFTIALLVAEFGQVPGATKSHTTSGEVVRLYNCAVVDEGFG